MQVPRINEGATLYEAALQYADAGFKVLVTKKGAKEPGQLIGKDWQHKATDDPDGIKKFFERHLEAVSAIGCEPGRSGLVIIDVDKPHLLLDVIKDAIEEHKPPFQASRTNVEGKGHYIFRMPEGRQIGCSNGGLAGGWGEVKAIGGFIMLAPTPHRDAAHGGLYHWENIGEIPVLPKELADALPDVNDNERKATADEVQTFLRTYETASDAGRFKPVLNYFNGCANDKQSRHNALRDALPWALREAKWGYYSADRAVSRLRNAFEKATDGEDRGNEFDSLVAWAVAQATLAPNQGPSEKEEVVSEEETASWSPIDLTSILDGTHKPKTPTILSRKDGVKFLYPGAMHSIYGEPESGKSWVFMLAAAEVLRDGGTVLCIDFESDAGSIVNRLRVLGVELSAIRERFAYVQPEVKPKHSQDAFDELIATQYDLVGIDGLTACLAIFGYASREEDDIAMWINEFPKRFSRNGASVLMMDHVVKSNDGRGRFATGSHYKLGAIDGASYVIEMTGPFGKYCKGIADIRIAKDRHGELRQYGGKFRSDRTQDFAQLVINATDPDQVSGDLLPATSIANSSSHDDMKPVQLMEKLSRFIEENPGVNKRGIEDGVAGDNMAIRGALASLVEDGFVEINKEGRALRHSSVKAYRTDVLRLDRV